MNKLFNDEEKEILNGYNFNIFLDDGGITKEAFLPYGLIPNHLPLTLLTTAQKVYIKDGAYFFVGPVKCNNKIFGARQIHSTFEEHLYTLDKLSKFTEDDLIIWENQNRDML